MFWSPMSFWLRINPRDYLRLDHKFVTISLVHEVFDKVIPMPYPTDMLVKDQDPTEYHCNSL